MSETPPLAHTLATTSQASPHRACFLLRVRPEKLAEYADVHQRVWDEMLQALRDAGWRHYSLFLDPHT
ncbi:MAG: L-rhamnose mutarotase, partial [Actinomyces bouchesdurhonensis]|nr:L-rhamnose mutarotase [Actinomyces bouchesdurhonensis]